MAGYSQPQPWPYTSTFVAPPQLLCPPQPWQHVAAWPGAVGVMVEQPQRQYIVTPDQCPACWVGPQVQPPMQAYNSYPAPPPPQQQQYLPHPSNTQAAYPPETHQVRVNDTSSTRRKQPSLPTKRQAPSDRELLKELELAYEQVYNKDLELETEVVRLQSANSELAKEQGVMEAAAQQYQEQLERRSEDLLYLLHSTAQRHNDQLAGKDAELERLQADAQQHAVHLGHVQAIAQRKEGELQEQAEQLRKLQVAAEQHEGQLRQKDAELEQLRRAAQRWLDVKPMLLKLRAQQEAGAKRDVVGSSSAPPAS